ncbi:MAG: hypothetical protein IID45_15425 [Planctomycetes bacterium]|nr:hypothetical protein [Planctomycetota bacterium]
MYKLVREGFHLSVAQAKGKDRVAGLEVTHSQAVLHVDAHGFVVGKYNGLSDTEMMALRRVLLADADSGPENEPLLPEFQPSQKQSKKRARPVRASRPRSAAAGSQKDRERSTDKGNRDG